MVVVRGENAIEARTRVTVKQASTQKRKEGRKEASREETHDYPHTAARSQIGQKELQLPAVHPTCRDQCLMLVISTASYTRTQPSEEAVA